MKPRKMLNERTIQNEISRLRRYKAKSESDSMYNVVVGAIDALSWALDNSGYLRVSLVAGIDNSDHAKGSRLKGSPLRSTKKSARSSSRKKVLTF